MGKEIEQHFDKRQAQVINRARLDHLASLGLDLCGKTVLEVGAGVGYLTGFFEERGCSVISTDGRPQNVQMHLKRHPHRKVYAIDLASPKLHAALGTFDVVFCYGTLYHLDTPLVTLRGLAAQCKELFLLESRVYWEDNGELNWVRETITPNQSLRGRGCRPARDWIMRELGRLMFAYLTRTQPNYPDYVLKWPTGRRKVRAVFVGSKTELDLPTLSPTLLHKQERFTGENGFT